MHLEKNPTPAHSGFFFFSSAALGAICVFTASRSVYVFSLWRSAGRLVLGLVVAYDQREGAAARHTEGDLNRGPRGSDNLTE